MGAEKISQKTHILNWMMHGYTITPKDAIELCQCYRLSARIADLRKEGWLIVKETPRVKGAHYAVYRLLGREDEEGGLTNDAFK